MPSEWLRHNLIGPLLLAFIKALKKVNFVVKFMRSLVVEFFEEKIEKWFLIFAKAAWLQHHKDQRMKERRRQRED